MTFPLGQTAMKISLKKTVKTFINICMLLCTTFSIMSLFNTAYANITQSDKQLQQLQLQINQLIEKHNLPGLAFAIVDKNKLPIVEVIGNKSVLNDAPITINTPFRIASISKLVVGIAAMQQIERGNVSMQDRLDELLPWLEYENPFENEQAILLKHLLENTTGWDEISLQEFAYQNNPRLSLKQSLSVNANSRKSRWQPGTRHAYTNSAATVVAAIVEQTSGKNFYDYVQTEIFAPLNIKTASYQYDAKSMAQGHINGKPAPVSHVLMTPSGALNISIADMATLANEFISDNPILLKKSSFDRMEMSTTTNAGQFSAGYGVYNYARFYDDVRYRGHDGALPAWLSEFSYNSVADKGFVVFQNSQNGRAFREIVRLIHLYLSATTPDSPRKKLVKVTDQEHKNKELSGFYRMTNPRSEKRFFLERIVSSHKLHVQNNQATFTSVFPKGWRRSLVYVGEGKWANTQDHVVMKSAIDPVLGEVLHYGDRVFIKEPAINAYLDKAVLVVWLFGVIGFFGASIVWSIKRIRKTLLINQSNISLRTKQRSRIMLANIGACFFLVFLSLGLQSPIDRLGQIGLFSLGLMMSSLLLLFTTFYSAFLHVKTQKLIKQRTLFLIGGAYLFLQLTVVIYLFYFGVIGMRAWA